MNALIAVLRLIHILAGVCWAGGAIIMALFIGPSLEAIGADGARFAQQLTQRSRLHVFMGVFAWLNVLAGLALLGPVSGGFDPAWMRSPSGITLSLGMLMALLALGHGMAVQVRNAARLAALGRAVAAGGAPPSPEQARQMQALRDRLGRGARITASLLALAVVAMAIERYVG